MLNPIEESKTGYQEPAQHLSCSSNVFAATKPLPSIHTAPMMPPPPCHGIAKIHAMPKEVMGNVDINT